MSVPVLSDYKKRSKASLRLMWLRRDLRLVDNHALDQALSGPHLVQLVFIFDSSILGKLQDKNDARVTFIYERLREIDAALNERGSGLWVTFGDPVQRLVEWVRKYDVLEVFANEDYEPYARKRDERVSQELRKLNVPFHVFKDQVIFAKSEVTNTSGLPYTVYTPFAKRWRSLLSEMDIKNYGSERKLERLYRGSSQFQLTLESMGFEKSLVHYPRRTIRRSILQNYEINRDFPAKNGTSKLGVHLRFGTLSVRHAVQLAVENSSSWLNELIWREFFMAILYHFPETAEEPFKAKFKKVPWRNSEADFERWANGQTGYPLVDAGMRELNSTGYMHNRVRMVTASFLTKHLLLPWQWGERYFARRLLDFELSSNVGNWQWVAGCGCDAAPYFRIFNPSLQAKKFDSDGGYVRTWLPEMKTNRYPLPMLDHEKARLRALTAFSRLSHN